ncbi:hypothetical protein KRX57_06165 [Weeksellaceae bacterium TAE3-ERU29]|nr:hypothetical protein [Weeksellaceae bacterium TAE3-ERU29]
MKKDSVGNFETWKDYLKRVKIITKQDLKIYDKPNGKVIFENKENEHLPFNIVELKGDWAKIEKLGGDFKQNDFKKYNGWTQWKKGSEILIDIVEYVYE